ncbi:MULTISPECIES: patatin-like protein [unclassified Sphingopyxis]|uniref:patatin-like protein n=1 Tax=unclassified Sphingopyxis TaxID=2614943 RepID=UPI00073117EE|nr:MULTISPECIES: patatin-like protein [unclassified Sphingopyxis]KTE25941.1 patatin [Sphingopyxis sp. H057]KTE51621.1 patatin [Sphingopyxis sp. H073]KTE53876.1 patatin [Sphingopyxis sp. H071]KTE58879.1 patatin [Sphingopyxis sp. H107]KTE65500.1 patatin [Sphingopyxis sp. H100]
MREKELRFALICYGGISLAVYMHGITKEVWRLAAASRAFHEGRPQQGSGRVYGELLTALGERGGVRLRVMADIVAGASAGGINGIFLARAIATGQSLDPLTELWLKDADVDYLLDPDARPLSAATKFWAVPIAGWAMKRRGNVIDRTVGEGAQEEVRAKLSRFVRARWFEPPFGGETFSNLLLDAFDAMDSGPVGPSLVPTGQPVDLFVSVTDFAGHSAPLSLNSPPRVTEQEHRLVIHFRQDPKAADGLDDVPALAAAARATASFPGAFPPFTLRELDRVLGKRGIEWPGRDAFIRAQLPAGGEADPADRVLIDGSVLANAPFRPAIAALKQRPARREIDRRFVYIDPKPDYRSISFGKPGEATAGDEKKLPGFMSTILGALSEIPREQPIRDNVEAIEGMSRRIRRMQYIIDAMKVEVEEQVAALFGTTFFLDTPTPARLQKWRAKAQDQASARAGFAYAPYGHLKLSAVVEELVGTVDRLAPPEGDIHQRNRRNALWDEVRARGLDRLSGRRGLGASDDAVVFFRTHDLGFRIRRLRFLARELDRVVEAKREARDPACDAMRDAIYAALGQYVEREGDDWLSEVDVPADAGAAAWIDAIGARRDLIGADAEADNLVAEGLAQLPKDDRRKMLLAYLGYPFYDIATLPLLQGEGFDEFDPIKVDRISPSDATAIRTGGAGAMLKGIEFNSFGAFFSRAYRENDYLWGRLHGADRLVDIVASSVAGALSAEELAAIKRRAFHAILDEEESRLPQVKALIDELRVEIG